MRIFCKNLFSSCCSRFYDPTDKLTKIFDEGAERIEGDFDYC